MIERVGQFHQVMVAGTLSAVRDMIRALRGVKDMGAVHYVASGEEAINNYTEMMPDLMLIDVLMDGSMSGIEAAKLIRGQNRGARMVLVSEAFNKEFLTAAREAGMNGYMVRCLDPLVLHQLIREVEDEAFYFFMV